MQLCNKLQEAFDAMMGGGVVILCLLWVAFFLKTIRHQYSMLCKQFRTEVKDINDYTLRSVATHFDRYDNTTFLKVGSKNRPKAGQGKNFPSAHPATSVESNRKT